MVGEYEAALEQIELLLSIPGHLSTKLLQLDPVWKPLWNHPEFKRLMDKYYFEVLREVTSRELKIQSGPSVAILTLS